LRKGTIKLLNDEYERFCKAMLVAAEDGALPVGLQINNIKDVTLKDIADICNDFIHDTGLEMTAHCSVCHDCEELHVLFEIDYPYEEGDEDNITYLQ